MNIIPKPILYCVCIVVILIIGAWAYFNFQNPFSTDQARKISDQQEQKIRDEYTKNQQELEKKNSELEEQLKASMKVIDDLKKKEDMLNKKKESIHVPTTVKEIRDRFTSLGYPPV